MRGQAHDVLEIVCHEHERDIERASQLVDLVLQTPAHGAIDRGKWFVQEQHGRFAGEGPCQRDTLALASRKLLWAAVVTIGEVHEVEQLVGARASLTGGPMTERGHHVASRRQVREERVLLKHERQQHGDVAARRCVLPCRSTSRDRNERRRVPGDTARRCCAGSSSCRCPTARRSPGPPRDRT